MGDFTGFTFGGYHSFNDLNIIRVSGGDRYEEELHSEIKDITAEIPGLNGEYYFGSDYGPRKFEIDIAFDSLTEVQFRKLRRIFGTKRMQELIFDERPYKKYMAKIESPIELSYVCFDEPKRYPSSTASNGIRRDRENDEETTTVVSITDTIVVPPGEEVSFTLTHIPNGEVIISPEVEYIHEEDTYDYVFSNEEEESITITLSYSYDEVIFVPAWEQITQWEYGEGTQRIYKGEGKISFICYFPFAKSVYKVLPYSYQLTTDTEIQPNKKYFKLEGMLYVVVAEPDVSEIDTYYERVTNEGSEDWAISSGILSENDYEGFDTYDDENQVFKIYNPGDVETGFRLYLPAAVAAEGITLTYKPDHVHTSASLVIKPITLKTNQTGVNDLGVLIDTTNEIIAGVSIYEPSSYQTSGNIYNEFVESGYFFKFEPTIDKENYSTLEVSDGENLEIYYDYLYF